MQKKNRWLDIYSRWVLDKKWLWFLIVILISIYASVLTVRLPVVTSIDSLVPKKDPARIFYQKFRGQFGADDGIAVAFKCKDCLKPFVLRYIRHLTKKLEEIKGVSDVLSLSSVEDIVGEGDAFIVEPLLPDKIPEPKTPKGKKELRWIKKRALSNPLIVGNLISPDAKSTLLLVRTTQHFEDYDFDARVVKEIKKVLKENPPPKGISPLHIAGWPVTDVAMAKAMNRDMALFIPITAILMGLMLYWFLRAIPAVVVIMMTMGLSLLWTVGSLTLIGGALSPLTSILPPLIMALSLADGIHVCARLLGVRKRFHKEFPNASQRDLILQVIKELWWPCFLTSFTTAVGFASLALSDIPSIRHFGIAAAMGMMLEYCLTFLFLPHFLGWVEVASRVAKVPLDSFIEGMGNLVLKVRYWVLFITAIFSIVSLIGCKYLRVDTNLLAYFRASSPVRKGASFVDKNLGGVDTLEISLKAKEPNAFLNPHILNRVEELESWLKKRPEITKIIDFNDFIKLMNQAFHSNEKEYYRIPKSKRLIAQYLLIYDGSEMNHFIDQDYQWMRVSARTPYHSTRILMPLIREIQNELDIIFKDTGISAKVTGKTYLTQKMSVDIVNSQIESLASAMIIVLGLFFFVLRSFWLGIIAIIPNILPIIGNLGLMGLVGIPINTATAIISAVAIGIAVDDTIHFTIHYSRFRQQGHSVFEAIAHTWTTKGLAAIATSVVLIGGFGILIFSDFIPTAEFGFLCALIMFVALLADLFVLPALLALRGDRKSTGGRS